MAADGIDLLAHAHREHAGTPMAFSAFVLIDGHGFHLSPRSVVALIITPAANVSP
jgi:hypothetical protein